MTTFPRTFTIHIEGCKDLLNRDGFGGGFSDPYVVVTHKKQQKLKTLTVNNTLDPQWNESDGSFVVWVDNQVVPPPPLVRHQLDTEQEKDGPERQSHARKTAEDEGWDFADDPTLAQHPALAAAIDRRVGALERAALARS